MTGVNPLHQKDTDSLTDAGQTLTADAVIYRYYSLWMIYSLGSGVILSVYPVFLRSHGLTQFRTNAIVAISYLIVFSMDVPAGVFADTVGRSISFVLGNMIRSVGWLLYYFAGTFGRFVAADSTAAFGSAFSNGTLEAWAVDALDQSGFTADKSGVFSRVSQLRAMTAILGAIAGAQAAGYSMRLPWAIGAVTFLITGLAGAVMMKPDVAMRRTVEVAPLIAQVRVRLLASISIAAKNRTVLMLALSSGLQIFAWSSFEMEWQKYFVDNLYLRIGTVGLLYCIFRVASIGGSEVVARLCPLAGVREYYVAIAGGISGAILFIAGRFNDRPVLVLVLLCGAYVCFGIAGPLMRTWANDEIDRDHRATLLSFFNTFETCGSALGLLVGGRLADLLGLRIAWQLSGVLAMLSVPIILRAAAYSGARDRL
ncbi:MAG TPA: MFS transporter [Candidatus Binataceae bacterium]|nr:MFS transporter [Candidatus Binataceae bacterium]